VGRLEQFTVELLHIVAEQIADNEKGVSAVGSDYWFGRLFDSEDFKAKIHDLIEKYGNS
jgi:hypothetical protein